MKRNLHVALGSLLAASVIAGCGGSGATIGNSGPSPGSIATPTLAPGVTPSPTPAGTLAPGQTPSPTPSPSASATPMGSIYHPSSNADAFTMVGSLLVTYSRPNQFPSPEPTSTTLDQVTQQIAVSNPASFNGTSGVEFAISETDNQIDPTTQTFGDTLDQYYSFSNTIYAGNFLDLGYNATDDTGYTVGLVNGPNDRLADVLPETAGATWSNAAGRTLTTNDGMGQTSSTTYADDGSYTGTITYPNLNPSPNPTGSQLTNTATLVAKTDGSAQLVTPRDGLDLQYDSTYTMEAPTASGPSGTITVTTLLAPAANSTSTPEATSTTIPNWMPASVPGSLASETDVDNGPMGLPSQCSAASAISSSTPNQIVQTKTSVDPLNGVLDTATTTTYDTVNVGPVCVILHDVATAYYDLSGANGASYFEGAPIQVTTTDETLALSAETIDALERRPELRDRFALTRSVNLAIAQARIEVAKTKARLRRLDAIHRGVTTRDAFRSFRGVLK